MDIDFNTRGTESSTAKIMKLSGSARALETSWMRYSRAASTGGMAGRAFAGVKGAAGGAAGSGILTGALGIFAISRLLQRSEAIRNSKLLEGDVWLWGRVAKESRVNWRLLMRKYNKSFDLKMKGGALGNLLSGTLGGRIGGKAMGKTLGKIISFVKRLPVVTIAAVVAGTALMDERVSKAVSKAMTFIGGAIQQFTANVVGFVGGTWASFKNALAKVTGNEHYATSQFDHTEAVKQFSPEKQRKFLEDTEKQQRDKGMEVTIEKTKRELLAIFRAENEKNNMQYKSIVETMRYAGRL